MLYDQYDSKQEARFDYFSIQIDSLFDDSDDLIPGLCAMTDRKADKIKKELSGGGIHIEHKSPKGKHHAQV
jgi:hypothetical protein